MKILITDTHEILKRGRVFAGRGASDLAQTGLGFPTNAVMHVQAGLVIEPYTTFWGTTATSLVSMGAFSYTHSRLPHGVKVGRYTSIARGLTVMGDRHPHEWASTSPVFYNHRTLAKTFMHDMDLEFEPKTFTPARGIVNIGNDVWIGENVTLSQGITIGDGAVVASNAVVTKDIRAYTVVGGLPAKKIRDRFPAETIEKMLESQWWNYSPDQISPHDVTDPDRFAHTIVALANQGLIEPYEPKPTTYKNFVEISA